MNNFILWFSNQSLQLLPKLKERGRTCMLYSNIPQKSFPNHFEIIVNKLKWLLYN